MVSERDGDTALSDTRCYRFDRQHLWFGICQVAYCGSIGIVTFRAALGESARPGSDVDGLAIVFAILWGCLVAIGLFQVLSYVGDRLVLSPEAISKRVWIGKSSLIQNAGVLRIIWNESGKRRIRLQTATVALTINLDEYPDRYGREIIANVRRRFPAEIQQGWDEFCRSEPQRNRLPQNLMRIAAAAAVLLLFAAAILFSLNDLGERTVSSVFSLLIGSFCGLIGNLLLWRVFPVIDRTNSVIKTQVDESIIDQDDTRCYQWEQRYFSVGVLCVICGGILGIFATLTAVFERNGPEPELIVIVIGSFICGGFIVLGLFLMIFNVRERQLLSPAGIFTQGFIERQMIRSTDVTRVKWCVFSSRSVLISGFTGEIAVGIGNFRRCEQDEIIEMLRNLFPEEIQENWQAYSERETHRKEWEARLQEPEHPSQKKAMACALIFFIVGAVFAFVGHRIMGTPALGASAFCGAGGMWYVWRIWRRWRKTNSVGSAPAERGV